MGKRVERERERERQREREREGGGRGQRRGRGEHVMVADDVYNIIRIRVLFISPKICCAHVPLIQFPSLSLS